MDRPPGHQTEPATQWAVRKPPLPPIILPVRRGDPCVVARPASPAEIIRTALQDPRTTSPRLAWSSGVGPKRAPTRGAPTGSNPRLDPFRTHEFAGQHTISRFSADGGLGTAPCAGSFPDGREEGRGLGPDHAGGLSERQEVKSPVDPEAALLQRSHHHAARLPGSFGSLQHP